MIHKAGQNGALVTEYRKDLKWQNGVEISNCASVCIIQAGIRLPFSCDIAFNRSIQNASQLKLFFFGGLNDAAYMHTHTHTHTHTHIMEQTGIQ